MAKWKKLDFDEYGRLVIRNRKFAKLLACGIRRSGGKLVISVEGMGPELAIDLLDLCGKDKILEPLFPSCMNGMCDCEAEFVWRNPGRPMPGSPRGGDDG